MILSTYSFFYTDGDFCEQTQKNRNAELKFV